MTACAGRTWQVVGPDRWPGQQPLVRDDLHDVQTAIESWVERGKAPSKFVATKFTTDDATATTVQFTRPLCAHPKIARYKGGDPNSAASFVCVGGRGNGGEDDGEDDDD